MNYELKRKVLVASDATFTAQQVVQESGSDSTKVESMSFWTALN